MMAIFFISDSIRFERGTLELKHSGYIGLDQGRAGHTSLELKHSGYIGLD